MTTSKLIEKLQEIETSKSYLFTKGFSKLDISTPIEMENILFRKMSRYIGYCPSEELPFEIYDKADSFDCYAYKESYTLLGIILCELLFGNQSFIEITVPNRQSEIKQLFVYVSRGNNPALYPFLKVKQHETYHSFEYFSQNIGKYPFIDLYGNENVPTFRFSSKNHQDKQGKNQIEKADQLILSTSITGLIRMAELFFNIGKKDNKQNEICLENPLYGVGGVSETSVEARFWLPDSFGFYTDKIDDLRF
tara:strand:- start:593 stop:1342 length:750 start_codon:yes stop_codon:yes gene_type:complete